METKTVSMNSTFNSSPSFNSMIGDVTFSQSAGVMWTLSSQTSSKFTSFATSEKHIDDIGNTRPSGLITFSFIDLCPSHSQ